MMNKIITAIICFIVTFSVTAIAGRPLAIDDADPVDVGTFEFELGESFVRFRDSKHWDFPFGLTYGLVPALEAGIGFGGQYETRAEFLKESEPGNMHEETGLGDLVIGAKWQFYKETDWLPRMALVPSVKLPTADEDKGLGSGEIDCDVTWVASKALSDDIGVHMNVGYSWIGEQADEDAGDIIHYGVASDFQVTDSIQLVGEVFSEYETGGEADTALRYSAGFRWAAAKNLTLDLAGGSKIYGDAPALTISAGLTLAFGK